MHAGNQETLGLAMREQFDSFENPIRAAGQDDDAFRLGHYPRFFMVEMRHENEETTGKPEHAEKKAKPGDPPPPMERQPSRRVFKTGFHNRFCCFSCQMQLSTYTNGHEE
jgi:hypothetical protein